MRNVIPYEMIRHSVPDALKKKTRSRGSIKAWQGLLYFAAVLLLLLLFGGLVYLLTGNYLADVFLQQLFFLGSALLMVVLCRDRFSEIFPLKKPRALAIGGVLVLTLAMFLLADVYSILVLFFAPGALEQVSEQLDDLLQIPSLPLELLLTAVCPAICEEAMHRGVILHSFRHSLHRKWPTIFLSAAIFGVFHLYPVRMVMPALLGILIGILVWETDNMVYGFLLHLCYNGSLTLVSRLSERIAEAEALPEADALSSTASGLAILTMGILIPLLVWLGLWMVRRCTAPRIPELIPPGGLRKTLLWILLPTAGIVSLGMIVFLS